MKISWIRIAEALLVMYVNKRLTLCNLLRHRAAENKNEGLKYEGI
ncbi:MAG TPA: hypothetical protein VE594_03790 [Nitrososphaeraceae archaeon]|jgi:hypothetical protein|nr:hypothetical protein [Nitrososphaeraceae archaeon]